MFSAILLPPLKGTGRCNVPIRVGSDLSIVTLATTRPTGRSPAARGRISCLRRRTVPTRRGSMRKVLIAAFGCLVVLKFYSAIPGSLSSGMDKILPALMYAALFGSPQLFWLAKCTKPLSGSSQAKVAALLVIAFTLLSVYFGSFPGTRPPSWAGEAHFEVPAALLAEWLVALVAVVPFRAARGSDERGV